MLQEDQEISIEKTALFVREILEGEGSGHDWWHIHRVRNNALNIAKAYDVDIFIIELAALLHDIADHKFHDGDETVGLRKAEGFLKSISVDDDIIEEVLLIMKQVSFSKGVIPSTIEGRIVQDADRLDAIGAIGIARTFAFGGFKKREIYNPDIPAKKYKSLDEYKKNTNPTLNHFYEKLLLLKNLMNTKEAKRLAEGRHDYMKEFLAQFYAEWDAEL